MLTKYTFLACSFIIFFLAICVLPLFLCLGVKSTFFGLRYCKKIKTLLLRCCNLNKKRQTRSCFETKSGVGIHFLHEFPVISVISFKLNHNGNHKVLKISYQEFLLSLHLFLHRWYVDLGNLKWIERNKFRGNLFE